MLPGEPNPPSSRLRKLRPSVKLPSAALLQSLAPADAKRLRRLLTEPVEYVHDDFFDQPHAADLLLRPLHKSPAVPGSDDSGAFQLRDVHPAVVELDRERYLFLRLNYCRQQLFNAVVENSGRRLTGDAAAELLRWERRVSETREEVIRDNVPLVLAMAKRTRIPGVDLTDLISEGNLALMRSVNKFDSARGYRFSTYACRAILKSFSRVAARMARHRGHFPTEFDPALEKGNAIEIDRKAREGDCVHELRTILVENAAGLSDVEQKVILARFALDGAPADAAARAKTLEQVGEMIGVTKERVRQIQNKALLKLRAALEATALT